MLTRFALIMMIATHAQAATEKWPSRGLEPYMKPSGQCDRLKDLPEMKDQAIPPLELAGLPAFSREWARTHRESMCRALTIGAVLKSDPAKFCPGFLPERAGECFAKVTDTAVVRAQMPITSMVALAGVQALYFLERKDIDPSARLGLVESALSVLEMIEYRATPAKSAAARAANGSPELRLTAQADSLVARNFARMTLAKLDEIIAPDDSESIRGRFLDLKRFWKFPDPTYEADAQAFREALGKHPELSFLDR